MQVSPPTPAAKATRKAKQPLETLTVKKPARSRKKAPVADAAPETEVLALTPSPEEVAGMIATAAYYLAAERHFAAGHELDDWLEAERQVRARFAM